jgi:hypothetical protein
MVEPHLVGALWKKRAEIVGRIIRLEKELRQGRADLRHLDATLRLFAPNLALSSSRNGLFRRGECSRRVLTLLRGAEQSLTTWDNTDQLLAANRVSPSDTQARNALHKTALFLGDSREYEEAAAKLDLEKILAEGASKSPR